MDQTSIAVTLGFVSSPCGAIILKRITGWSRWIALPLGAISSFLLVTVSAYVFLELLGRLIEQKEE